MTGIKSLLVVAHLAALITMIGACGDGLATETASEHFANREQAEQAEAINRGIVPDWIPQSATDIWSEAELDVSRLWVRFEFSPSDLPELTGGLVELAPSALSRLSGSGLRAEWWDPCLGGKSSDSTCFSVYTVYDASEKNGVREAYLAIDSKGKRGYYWVVRPGSG